MTTLAERIDALAVKFCDAFTDWEHHDQTDDHPCSRCKQYAAAALALSADA